MEANIGASRISRAEGVPGGGEVGVGSEEARSPTRSGMGAVAERPGIKRRKSFTTELWNEMLKKLLG